MDFFAAGGFQQLFSDLNDTQLHGNWTDTDADMESGTPFYSYNCCAQQSTDNSLRLSCADDPYVFAATTCEKTLVELHVDWDENEAPTTYNTHKEQALYTGYAESKGNNEQQLQLTLDRLLCSPSDVLIHDTTCDSTAERTNYETLTTQSCSETEYHNNSCMSNTPSSPVSLDSTIVVEFETAAFITREMAEWEEKFLDNYIEIPELIDFLPEKTPLCTDTCDHFLHESSKNLKLHRKTRTTKRSNESSSQDERVAAGFPCTFGSCDKIYAKPAHLKAHLRRHMGEKPYTCDWPACTWKFSRSDELARHRRSHSGVKPYKCSYCLKCFARSDHLTKHRKVHERRLLAASKAGKTIDGVLPHSVLTVRPGRKRKNQL
ncbi:PREDICTED: oocyte zinc finger protein XlCOF28 [Bactrocera latifrons]|uniref:oocyte zinc finger protein XlCOF28 n=1 Tax=Bactrocera latifrons TaxID=174628 RepID=UPI0008DE43BA|nr:PREDICTED: oocyte zinc finger protein XlCOF28 [Bactrocera latifrons]